MQLASVLFRGEKNGNGAGKRFGIVRKLVEKDGIPVQHPSLHLRKDLVARECDGAPALKVSEGGYQHNAMQGATAVLETVPPTYAVAL